MPATARVPPRSSARSATGTSSPAGANRIAPSSGSGGCAVGRAHRVDAELGGQAPVALAAGQHVHAQPLSQRDLGGEVCAAAEPVDAEPAAGRHRRAVQRAVADDAGAQQRRGLLVVDGVGQPIGERLVDHAGIGVAAVEVPAGEPRVLAEVLLRRCGRSGRCRRCRPARRRRSGRPPRTARHSGPRASTTPTTSWPGTVSGRCGARSPSARCRSVRQTPQQRTATRTCPGPGSGRSRSIARSGPPAMGPGSCTAQHLIVAPSALVSGYGSRSGPGQR